jgi:hypothetical protein
MHGLGVSFFFTSYAERFGVAGELECSVNGEVMGGGGFSVNSRRENPILITCWMLS